MSGFTLDTSGTVWLNRTGRDDIVSWHHLDPFPQGCIEALFASLSTLCETCQGNGEVVTDWGTYLKPPEGAEADAGTATCAACDGQGRTTYAFSDLSPEALALILKDCAIGAVAYSARAGQGFDRADKVLGSLFWERRQEGRYPRVPPLTPYLRDDGKVDLRETQP